VIEVIEVIQVNQVIQVNPFIFPTPLIFLFLARSSFIAGQVNRRYRELPHVENLPS
jgi:hypothetical protein